MKKLILSSLAKTINAALNLDTESSKRIAKLKGKTILIEFLPLHMEFKCHFNETDINILNDDEVQADASIRGTPLQMIGVMLAKENRHRFFAEDILIEGDAEFAQQVVNLFDHLKIDWEEHLSQLTGDIPAYHAARVFRQFNHFLSRSTLNICSDIGEYLQEEKEWLPSREALNDFFADIDNTRMDVDRMEAKINCIAKLIEEVNL